MAVADTASDLGRLRALIVEDNEHMRILLRALLNALHIRKIKECRDGAEALSVLTLYEPDFVLTDLSMVPMDGIEFTRAVRGHQSAQINVIPVIMVTGHTEKKRIEAARDAGVTELLVKPVAAAALFHRIEEIILRPRAFVRAPAYYGPDRRRHAKPGYPGPWRRKTDPQNAPGAVLL